jgi:LPXTG-motif cell wall-anchored protein
MKNLKNLIALVLAFAMIFAVMTANAATITINQNNTDGTAGAETYVAYKIFDVTKTSAQASWSQTDDNLGAGTAEGFAYTVNAESAWINVLQHSGYFTLTLSAEGDKYTVALVDPDTSTTDNENNTEAKAKEIAAYLLANKPVTLASVDKKYDMTSNGTTATATVDDGYYLITSSLGTNLVVATSSITINTKNDYISDEKTVEKASVTVGENATYYIKVTLPASIDQSKPVTVHDVLDEHLKFNNDSVQVTAAIKTSDLGDTAPKDRTYDAIGSSYTLVEGDSVSETSGEKCTFEIVIPATQVAAIMDAGKTVTGTGADAVTTYNSTTIFFKYTAELLSTAANDTGYVNKEFSTYSEYTTQPTNPEVKTYDFSFTKVDGDSTKLDGAEFELYAAWDSSTNKASGDPIAFLKNADKVTYEKADTDDAAADTTTTIVVDSKTNNAATHVIGLGGADNTTGTNYYLVETKEPAGFNKLIAPIIVNVKDDGTITVSYNGTTLTSTNDAFDVVNNSGSVLPSTGGIGTTIFYILGSLLVLGAGIILVTKRRMSVEK